MYIPKKVIVEKDIHNSTEIAMIAVDEDEMQIQVEKSYDSIFFDLSVDQAKKVKDGICQFLGGKFETQHYSVLRNNTYTPKNKAQEEALKVFHAMDRKIISSDMVSNFNDAFIAAIDKINARNKRCKNLILNIWSPMDNEDWIISIDGVHSLSLRKAKEAE